MLQLLGDVCMRSFRKEVFLYLKQHSRDLQIVPEYESRAIGGEVSLTGPSLQRTLGILPEDLCVVWGNNMRVRHVDLLLAWLWDWDDAVENTKLGRLHWDHKPYRMLFRQCFTQIQGIYGGKEARTWHDTVKELFLRSHWMLPYPSQTAFFSRSKNGQMQWWCSVHDGLLHFLSSKKKCSRDQSYWVLEPWEIRLLPTDGWARGESPMDVDVNLAPVPQNLDTLAGDDSDHQTELENEHGNCSEESSIESRLDPVMVYSSGPSHIRRYHLRSYLKQHRNDPKIHQNPKWFLTYLSDLLHDVIESREKELYDLNPTQCSRPWQSHRHAKRNIAGQDHIMHTNSETDNDGPSRRQHEIQVELRTLHKQQQVVQNYVVAHQTQQRSMNHLRIEARRQRLTWTRDQQEKCQQRLQDSEERLQLYQGQLIRLSRQINRRIQFQQMSNIA